MIVDELKKRNFRTLRKFEGFSLINMPCVYTEKKLMKVIRWLLDNGKIAYETPDSLIWNI